MPYPVRQRKKAEVFQAFEEGGKHALWSQRVELARQRRKDRDRKNVEQRGESKKDVKSGSKKEKGNQISKPKAKTAKENVKKIS